jgi:methyltransferase
VSLWWVFSFLIAERLLELCIAERNRRVMLARGGREFFPETYKHIATLHLLFMLSLIIETAPWYIPLNMLTGLGLIAVILLQAGRYWCIASLGPFWNTRIIVLPGAKVLCRGPYRFMRHPNYLVVTLEFLVIPLLMRAPITLVLFSLINLVVLRQRIRLEEEVLRDQTNYREAFQL